MATLLKPLTGVISADLGFYIEGTISTTVSTDQAARTKSTAGSAMIFSPAAAAMTGCSANRATTRCTAAPATTCSTAATATIRWSGGAGADTLIGGDGFDTASYASSFQSVYVNLATNTGVFGDAQGDTFSGIDKVVGSNFSDGLFADDSGVVLDGGAGDDFSLVARVSMCSPAARAATRSRAALGLMC